MALRTLLGVVALAGLPQGSLGSAREIVTFREHIAPIILENCSVCHRPEGATPFSLLTYRDVSKRGRLIASVTGTRLMPPWPAAPGWGRFKGQRALSEEQIDLIARWVEAEMPEGDPAIELVPPPVRKRWEWGAPDLIVKMEESFEIPAEGPDIYRSFAVALGLEEDRWLRAIAFRPSARSAVHHALFLVDATGESRRLQNLDPQPGFASMTEGGGGSFSAASVVGTRPVVVESWLGTWAVGRTGWMLSERMASPLPAGSDLVAGIHFHPSGKKEIEEAEFGLYFAGKPLRTHLVLELPPLLGAFSGIDIPGGVAGYTIRDSFVLPVDVEALSATGHAHYLGKELKLRAILPDGREKGLLWIPDWDFSWQEQYQYQELVFLPRGTRLESVITYDNSTRNPDNPQHPPRRVVWGRETDDEMGSMRLWVVPVKQAHIRRLRSAWQRHLRKTFVGWLLDEPDGWEYLPLRLLERFDVDHSGEFSAAEKRQIRAFLDRPGRPR